MITPRLLLDHEAAAYLALPVAAVRRMAVGRVPIEGRVRWDRVALDAWLDARRGVAPLLPANTNQSEADAALERWAKTAGDHARPA